MDRATNDCVSACHRQASSNLKPRSPLCPEGLVWGQDCGCLRVPTSGTAACSISLTPSAAGEGVESEAPRPCLLWRECRWLHLLWLLPPQPPARPSPGTHRPPRGHREARAGAVGGGGVVPAVRVGRGGRHAWPGPRQPSKQQGFLLELVPLPERQAVKLFHVHPKHLLELLRRQVSLQTRRKTQREQLATLQRTHGGGARGRMG